MKARKNVFFQLASRNVRLNFSRSLLAALGIIIGVVAITAMGILGANIQLCGLVQSFKQCKFNNYNS